MSDVSQGPGWWIASDGKWYPPELHPFLAPPAPPAPPVPFGLFATTPTVPPPRHRRLSRPVIVGVAVALVVVALGATVLAVVSPSPSPGAGKAHGAAPTYIAPLTGFGGYHWLGVVNRISAQWRVPAIAATSPAGHASTWIGAQGNSGDAAFIQVGVTEDNFGPGQATYEEFWSDPAESYHPQPLGPVGAGDLISASMTRQSQGWSLTVDDRTRQSAITKLIRYGVGRSFTAGEWVQEDPTGAAESAVDLPYPETSDVVFQQLELDGHPPGLDLADGQTLSAADGIILVPSGVSHDSFTLAPATGVAAQYLKDAAGLDAALSAYSVELATWSATPLATRSLDVDNLSAAYKTNASELQTQSWPSAAQPDASLLARQLLLVDSDLQLWQTAGLQRKGNAYLTLISDQQIAPLADQLRAALGLPPA